MHYIVFDLEFNQDFTSLQNFKSENNRYPFEIIQIGAIKLDENFNTVGHFNHSIKPTFYGKISPFITELTGITLQQLSSQAPFPEIYKQWLGFINEAHAVSRLHIPITTPFHDAFHDAYYTAEIFKKIYTPSIEPSSYDPFYISPRPKPVKKQLDTLQLIGQFEKMYHRDMTPEEQTIIILAYKMGKTHQFLK